MSFDWSEYLILAQELTSTSINSPIDEILARLNLPFSERDVSYFPPIDFAHSFIAANCCACV